jgi:histidinol-phosphate aminotransferase
MSDSIEKTYSLGVFAPKPTEVVANIPASTPFVGPETLERQMGKRFELRLGANESLFGPSPMAVEAMRRAAEQGQFYGDPEGFELRSEIAKRNACSIDNVVLASGIDELLMLFSRAFLAPGDVAATTQGSYPTFEYAVKSVGGTLEYAQYADCKVDLAELADVARRSRAKIVYVANPDNPSGSWQRTAMDVAQGALLILDEAYSDFAPEVDNTITPNLVRMRTFSKGHGMAGIRIGYALCDADHLATLNKIRMHFGVSIVAQAGALAALRDTSHLKFVVGETKQVRNWLADKMLELGFGSIESHTNFLTIGLGSRARAEHVLTALREESVFIRKPSLSPLDGHIRVTIGPQTVMEEFLIRFRRILDRPSSVR